MQDFPQLIDPNSPSCENIEELFKCPYFSVIKFKYGEQTHYTTRPRRSDGVSSVIIREDGKFVMVQQQRPFFARPQLEFTSGGINDGESLEDAIRREVEEETGYKAISVTPLFSYAVRLLHASRCFVVRVGNTPGVPTEPDLPNAKVCVLGREELEVAIKEGRVLSTGALNFLYYERFGATK